MQNNVEVIPPQDEGGYGDETGTPPYNIPSPCGIRNASFGKLDREQRAPNYRTAQFTIENVPHGKCVYVRVSDFHIIRASSKVQIFPFESNQDGTFQTRLCKVCVRQFYNAYQVKSTLFT